MSSARQRQQRRRDERAPGVWRGREVAQAEPEERRVVEHGVRRYGEVNWRIFSGMIVVALSVALAMFFLTDFFYVRSVTVVGANYLDDSEVFRYADIAEMHIFWVNPDDVRKNILAASPVIADAKVSVSWPPNMVTIEIEEREPALIWVQAGVTGLIDLQGRVLRFPPDTEALPNLLRILADTSLSGPPGVEAPIPVDAVSGALQLRTLLAGVGELRYNAEKGLGFREPGGWDVWLGVGTDMSNKLLIYDAIRDNLVSRGITPVEINVSNPDGAYYCGSIEFCHG
jgi:hypothetical protein